MRAAEVFGPLARQHLDHPRNGGSFPDAETASIYSGEAGSITSGAFVRFHLRIREGRIAAARYEVLGGPALIACCSYLSELLQGRSASPLGIPRGLDTARALALPRAEYGAALLVEDAAHAALREFGAAASGSGYELGDGEIHGEHQAEQGENPAGPNRESDRIIRRQL